MADNTPRRWFCYGLRTLFVLMTVICVWLGWQMKIIRERQAMREWIALVGGDVDTDDSYIAWSMRIVPGTIQIPWIRRAMGDEALAITFLPHNTTKEEFDKIKKTFPEAIAFRRSHELPDD